MIQTICRVLLIVLILASICHDIYTAYRGRQAEEPMSIRQIIFALAVFVIMGAALIYGAGLFSH